MRKSDLSKDIKDVPNDAEIVISKCFVIDGKKEITGVLDIPIIGTAFNKESNELRFVLNLDDVKKTFHPKDVKFFDKKKNNANPT